MSYEVFSKKLKGEKKLVEFKLDPIPVGPAPLPKHSQSQFQLQSFTTFLRVISCQVLNESQDRYSKTSLGRINENFELVNANADKLVNRDQVKRERKRKQNKTALERKWSFQTGLSQCYF